PVPAEAKHVKDAIGRTDTKRRERKGKKSQAGEESRQNFAQSDFDEWHFVARLLQHAETAGVVMCDVQIAIGVAVPQPSQNAALARWKGKEVQELPLGLAGIQRHRLFSCLGLFRETASASMHRTRGGSNTDKAGYLSFSPGERMARSAWL